MADIDVVKKGTNVWLWIVLAIIVALVLWFMMGRRGDTANANRTGFNLYHAQPQAALVQPPLHA